MLLANFNFSKNQIKILIPKIKAIILTLHPQRNKS